MTDRKTIRITSDSVESAIGRAEKELRLPRKQLEVKVVQRESKGIVGRKKAVVECTFDPAQQAVRAAEHEICRRLGLKIMSKGIYLKVDPLPPEFAAKASYIIRRHLREKNIPDVDPELLAKVIGKQCGKYTLIKKPHVHEIGSAALSVLVTTDKMTAILIRYDLEPLESGQLLEYLESLNIRFGIRKEIVADPGDRRLLNNPVVIAEGVRAVAEEKAPLQYHFKADLFSVNFDENNSADYKNIAEIASVSKGQMLVSKGEPIEGKPGTRIDGVEIGFEVHRDGPIPRGRGVDVTPDGRGLAAAIDGHLVCDYGIVSVEPLYIIKGDVDYRTGNIDFDGGVVVCGDILPGFQVKATGRVEVRGVIDGGVVETDGNLIVRQGIFSKGTGHLRVGGTLIAKHVEEMTIKADKVRVHSNIINADVEAADYVEVFGDPGTIIGGTIRARSFIKANTVGSPMGNRTCLVVGSPEEVTQRISKAAQEIEAHRSNLAEIDGKLALADLPPDETGQLAVDSDILATLRTTEEQLRSELEDLERILNGLREDEKRIRHAKVHFRDHIYEGVNIRIFTGQMTVAQAIKHGSIVWENDETKVIHYHFKNI